MTDKIRQLKQWIKESNYLIFFGGAGVSTESGIPDFRGKNGLYRQKRKIPLEKILSHDFLWNIRKNTIIFYGHPTIGVT